MGTPIRLGSALLAALLGACASLPGPALEVTADCRVRATSGGNSSSEPAGGFSLGFGGGAAGAAGADSLATSHDAPATPTVLAQTSDGVPPPPAPSKSDGGHKSSGIGPGAAAAAAAAIFGAVILANASDPAAVLRADGPVLPANFSMSCLPLRGFVKGGWPVVMDYQADGSGSPSFEIHLADGGPAFVQPLDGARGRHYARFDLPDSLGAARPALVLVRAGRDGSGGSGLGRMQVFGLGAGPRAVGSVAIDQVDFSPPTLRRSARQTAAYSFYAHSDFNHVAVEVLRVSGVQGEIKVSLARDYRFDGGVSRGEWFGRAPPRTWDGSDARDQPSLGPHLVQVRAWMAAGDESDWVTAWSARTVQVTE